MAIALVGSAGAFAQGSSSVHPSFGQATTAGNLLIAWVFATATGGITVTGATGWTQEVANTNTGIQAAIFYKANCGASETSPTFNLSGAVVGAQLAEFSGAVTSSVPDQTAIAAGSSSPLSLNTGVADAHSGSLVIACDAWVSSKSGTGTLADSFNNGATATNVSNNGSTSSATHYNFDYGITTGNSAADTNSASNSNMNITSGAAVLASFKPVASFAGSKTQTAIARIQATPTKTQASTARIQNTVTKTQTATARIAIAGSKTQPAIARIQNTAVVKTQSAIARIQNTAVTKTQSAVARIQKTFTKTQPALARIQITSTKTQPATARVQIAGTKTQGALARIQNTAVTKTQSAVARIQQSLTATQPATARIQNTVTATQPATSRIQATVTKTQPAIGRIQNTVTATQTAVAKIAAGNPIAFVQSKSTAGDYGGGTGQSITLTAAPTQNDLLVAFISGANQLVSVSSLSGTGWTKAFRQLNSDGSDWIECWYKIAGASESATISWTPSATNSTSGFFGVAEYSGVDTGTPLLTSSGNSTAVSGTVATTASVTPTAGKDVVVVMSTTARYGGSLGTWSAESVGGSTTGVTEREDSGHSGTNIVSGNIFDLFVASTSGSYQGSATSSTSFALTDNGIAVFQAAPTTFPGSKTQTAVARIQVVGLTATQTAKARIQNTVTKAQTALARIQNAVSKTQPATARIQVTGTKTQGAVARIQNVVTKTQTAIARIQILSTKTQTAVARIAIVGTKTQAALARIQITGTKTQPATSRIQVVGLVKTQPATARVQNTVSKTQTATARISTANTFTKTQAATARIQNTVTLTQPATARVQATVTTTQPAKARISKTLTALQTAVARISKSFTRTQTATARISITSSKTQPATARISITATATQTAVARIVINANAVTGDFTTAPTLADYDRNSEGEVETSPKAQGFDRGGAALG